MRRALPLALLLVPVLNLSFVRAAEKQEAASFLRFVEEGQNGGRLETAVTSYKDAQGRQVHLVAAVHIADTGYYTSLNKLFEGYDALLYEMVKPKDAGAPGREEAEGVGLVRMLQKGMKMFLELDYQLDGVDYTKKNFVHADLTAEEFNRLQEERGESIFGLMLQTMLREMAKGNNKAAQDMDPMALLQALMSEDGARQLKLILAKQFQQMDDVIAGMEGPNGSVLLKGRNDACIKVLKEQLEGGKKNLGIFYGAAHMKEMEQQLFGMGFKRTALQWKVAWDMTPQNGAAAARPGNRAGQDPAIEAREAEIKRLQDRLEQLEKRIAEQEKKEKELK